MSRINLIKAIRTTRANLDVKAAAFGLEQGEPYLIVDEDRLAIGLSTSTYQTFLKVGEGGGGGGLSPVTTTIDFGTVPVYEKAIQVTDALALTSDKYFVSAAPDSDEYEMDALVCSAYCKTAGTITVFIRAQPGPITGLRKITYSKV